LAARRRIERLRNRGLSLRDIAVAAMLDLQSVHRIATGKRAWIHAQTEGKLMAVDLPEETPAQRLARQVKTLLRSGMSMRAIDRAVGRGRVLARLQSKRPTRAVRERVEQLYREA
jgi:DNA-binding transcriptional MerR regulator